MRSALLEVDGVARVQVTLEQATALVTYDARITDVEALVDAVNAAEGPQGPFQYTAAAKDPPRAAPSSQ